MSQRQLLIDRGPGETRGVVLLDGRPERLLIERPGESQPRVGDRYAARVVKVNKPGGLAFLDLGGRDAVLRLKAERAPPVQGAMLDVEITAEAQREKAAVARSDGAADGEPRRLAGTLNLEARLQAFDKRARINRDPETREIADEAEAEALAIEHPLACGGSIAIEATRALVAVDVDLGGREGVAGEIKRHARQANMEAIALTARLLRLKGLGGLVVIDLIGHSHDAVAIGNAAKVAFAPDQPGVVIGPITRFGTLELSLPQRTRPVAEILLQPDGRPTAATLALRMLRAVEREARAEPGARLQVSCAPEVAEAAEARASILADRIGSRFVVKADVALDRSRYTIGRA